LKAIGQNNSETTIIDSLQYKKNHVDALSVLKTSNEIEIQLQKKGYLECRTTDYYKENDSIFIFSYELGKKTHYLYIYVNEKNFIHQSYKIVNDTLKIELEKTEFFLESITQKASQAGYPLTKAQLIDFDTKGGKLITKLQIETNKIRLIDDIIVEGYEKFPKSYLHNLKRIYKNKAFNEQNVNNMKSNVDKFRFTRASQSPEVLFTDDSTKIYLYLEKVASNQFDGFIGFSNDNQDNFTLNGYVDLMLNNALNGGERIFLFWKNDGNQQTTLNAGFDLNYLFNSPIALKTEFQIFRQDSTFQNTKTAFDIGYIFKSFHKVFIGYEGNQSTGSNSGVSNISDFNNRFITSTFEGNFFKDENSFFNENTLSYGKIGFGQRNLSSTSEQQIFIKTDISHNVYLNPKNIFHIRNLNFYLKSDTYYVNELFRFGGVQSIRGFRENSLQCSFLSSIITEYRYMISESIYVHSITDYGYLEDKATNFKSQLYGFGFGFGLNTKSGLLNLMYANGTDGLSNFKLSNSIVHISLKTVF
jgi:hypothetical protein